MGGVTLPLAMLRDPAALAMARGRELVLGIRPEHLVHGAHAALTPGAAVVKARVELIEAMGDHQFVYVSISGRSAPLVMKTPVEHRCATGEEIRVHLLLEKAHLFDGSGDDAPNLSLPPGMQRIQPGR
jgi:ABC-type sugar transport system ATPase subunit